MFYYNLIQSKQYFGNLNQVMSRYCFLIVIDSKVSDKLQAPKHCKSIKKFIIFMKRLLALLKADYNHSFFIFFLDLFFEQIKSINQFVHIIKLALIDKLYITKNKYNVIILKMINGTPQRINYGTALRKKIGHSKQQIQSLNTYLAVRFQKINKLTLNQFGRMIIISSQNCLKAYLSLYKDILKLKNTLQIDIKQRNITTVKKKGQTSTKNNLRNQQTTKNKNSHKENVRNNQIVDIQELLQLELSSPNNNLIDLTPHRKSQMLDFSQKLFQKTERISLHSLNFLEEKIPNNIAALTDNKQNENLVIPNEIFQITGTQIKPKREKRIKNVKKKQTITKKFYMNKEQFNQQIEDYMHERFYSHSQNESQKRKLRKQRTVNTQQQQYEQFKDLYHRFFFYQESGNLQFESSQKQIKLRKILNNFPLQQEENLQNYEDKFNELSNNESYFQNLNEISSSYSQKVYLKVKQLNRIKQMLHKYPEGINFDKYTNKMVKREKASCFYDILCSTDIQIQQVDASNFSPIHIYPVSH